MRRDFIDFTPTDDETDAPYADLSRDERRLLFKFAAAQVSSPDFPTVEVNSGDWDELRLLIERELVEGFDSYPRRWYNLTSEGASMARALWESVPLETLDTVYRDHPGVDIYLAAYDKYEGCNVTNPSVDRSIWVRGGGWGGRFPWLVDSVETRLADSKVLAFATLDEAIGYALTAVPPPATDLTVLDQDGICDLAGYQWSSDLPVPVSGWMYWTQEGARHFRGATVTAEEHTRPGVRTEDLKQRWFELDRSDMKLWYAALGFTLADLGCVPDRAALLDYLDRTGLVALVEFLPQPVVECRAGVLRLGPYWRSPVFEWAAATDEEDGFFRAGYGDEEEAGPPLTFTGVTGQHLANLFATLGVWLYETEPTD